MKKSSKKDVLLVKNSGFFIRNSNGYEEPISIDLQSIVQNSSNIVLNYKGSVRYIASTVLKRSLDSYNVKIEKDDNKQNQIIIQLKRAIENTDAYKTRSSYWKDRSEVQSKLDKDDINSKWQEKMDFMRSKWY
jgi:hypothetical protein